MVSFTGLYSQVCYGQLDRSQDIRNKTQVYLDPGKCLQDLHELQLKLQDAHPCLYCFTDSLTLQRKFTELATELEERRTSFFPERITELEFTSMVKGYLATIKDGHLYAEGTASLSQYMYERGHFFPLELLFEGNKAYIRKDYTHSLDSVALGSELLAINDLPLDSILQSLFPLISVDADIELAKARQLENIYAFDLLYWLQFNPTETYRITYRISATSVPKTEQIEGVTSKAITFINSEKPTNRSLELYDSASVAYLDINSFYNQEEKKETESFEQFLRNSFQQINNRGIRNLVIDLRDNPGGLIYNAHLLFNFISPTNAESKVQLKSSHLLREARSHSFRDFFMKNFNSESYASKISRTPVGKLIEFTSQAHFVTNHKMKFSGKVYVLANANTFSAASMFAKLCKEKGTAVVIGEESGACASVSFGNLLPFLLPRTGIKVYVSTAFVVHEPLQPNNRRGIQPDIPVRRIVPEEVQGKDSVLRQTMDLVANKRLE
jgi:hypothetical protein